MCIDFYTLNANTKLAIFPLPCIADFLDRLGNAKYFSSIDLATTYRQVKIAKGDGNKTEFITKKGLYEYFVILFGLFNVPATFQILMNLIFADYINEFITIYLNNILVYSETY